METKKNIMDLQPGQSSVITSLIENVYTSKLMALGILPRTTVKMIRKAPFGNVFYIKLENHQLAIRAEEAKTIIIE